MAQPARKLTLYDDLMSLPEHITGEILNGQLHTQPRPGPPHGLAESSLQGELFNPFHKGKGGPGGWWILVEPEIHFVRKEEVVVPDLAGWRRTRMPTLPETAFFEVVPDWICEVLSPSTASKDREIKMPLYANYGVSHAWLVDPIAKTLDAFELQSGQWLKIGGFKGNEKISIPPFDAITIELSDLWC